MNLDRWLTCHKTYISMGRAIEDFHHVEVVTWVGLLMGS